MASAAEELIKMTGADISPSSTLLLDDDVNNVQVAVENDIRAVVYRIHDELGYVICAISKPPCTNCWAYSTIAELKAIGGTYHSGK
jgi:hypothetical protein